MSNAEVEFSILAGSGAPVRAFRQGEIIFREGDPATEIYVIKSGKVDVSSGNRQLATIGENGIFGEMALIDNAPRSATVVAETDCIVVPVGEKQFLFMTSETPYFALSLMRVLVGRLRAANNPIASM